MRSVSTATAKEINSLAQTSSWGRFLILGMSGAILIFAPLAYGAVHTWAYFSVGLATAFISLIMLAWTIYNIWARPDKTLVIPYPPLWWLAVGLVILTMIQVVAWPQGLVALLSPKAVEIRALGNGYGLAGYLPLSLNPHATLLEGLKLWPVLVLFFILIYTINSRRQLQGMVGLILAVALFEVFYGFWHFPSQLIWGWKNTYTGSRLCGTFINSNHLATFLTMAILLGFGLFLGLRETASSLSGGSSRWDRIRRRTRSEHLEPELRRFFLLFILLLLAVGLIFTGSRGGMISLLVGVALMGLLIWGQRWRRSHIFIMMAFLVAAVLYSLFLGSNMALGRFSDLDHDVRVHAFKGALALFKEFPLLGSGLATFGDLFYRYEPARLKGCYFIQTHNDWLQLLAETGLVGFFLVAMAWMVFFSVLAKQWGRRRQGFARGLALGGIAALSAGVFHGLVDFPFHIPAVSLLFAAIAALTYAAAHYHQQGVTYLSYKKVKLTGSHKRFAALLIVVALMVQLAFGVRVYYNGIAEYAAPTEINSTRIAPKLTVEDFRQALVYNPTNSKDYLGLAEILEGQAVGGKVPAEVEGCLKAAIFYAPANWGYRLKLAEFYLRYYPDSANQYIPAALQELSAAVALFPESGLLHFRLATILVWAERYYSGLIPAALRDSQSFHYNEAVRLEPRLQKPIPHGSQGRSLTTTEN